MNKKIVIAGGTGFVGQYLVNQFQALGYEVIIISRSNGLRWDDTAGIIAALDNAEMLINLAGKSVNCRYNRRNKAEILLSRTETTGLLGEAISNCSSPPEIWINSSTATIYRHAEDKPMNEKQGEIGSGFSVDIAKKWEKAFFDFKLPKTRQVALRMAIVLGPEGGVMKPFSNLVRFGLGGIQGNGKQMFSWIHIADLFHIILHIQSQKQLQGVLNCAAPHPIDNKTFMATFRKIMGIKIGLPSPSWLLEIGAVVIGTETELLLKSRWVIPEKLLEDSYTFKFPTIESALRNILSK